MTPDLRVQRFSMRGGTWKCKECREPINDGTMVHRPGCTEGAVVQAEPGPVKNAARKEGP
jgi:hypothetical protein